MAAPETIPRITIEAFSAMGDQELADIIAALHLDVRYKQREDGENYFHTNIHDSQTDLKAIDSFYVQPGGNFFVARDLAEHAIKVAGFVGLQRLNETDGRIKRLAVLPDYRKQHIGTRLVETAVQWATEAGLGKLILTTGQHENASPIYKDIGFEIVGYDENHHNDYLMEMEL